MHAVASICDADLLILANVPCRGDDVFASAASFGIRSEGPSCVWQAGVVEEGDFDTNTADVVVDAAEGIGEEDLKEVGSGVGTAAAAEGQETSLFGSWE